MNLFHLVRHTFIASLAAAGLLVASPLSHAADPFTWGALEAPRDGAASPITAITILPFKGEYALYDGTEEDANAAKELKGDWSKVLQAGIVKATPGAVAVEKLDGQSGLVLRGEFVLVDLAAETDETTLVLYGEIFDTSDVTRSLFSFVASAKGKGKQPLKVADKLIKGSLPGTIGKALKGAPTAVVSDTATGILAPLRKRQGRDEESKEEEALSGPE